MEQQILGILKEIQSDIKTMKGEIKSIKQTQEEHTEILRALQHSSEVAKSERISMRDDINITLGKVTSIENTLACVEMATAHNWMEITKIKSANS